MIGKLVPIEDSTGSFLWFEIPKELQGVVYNYLKEVIGTYNGDRIKKKFMSEISKRKIRENTYTSRIPIQFGEDVVFFNAMAGEWRVATKEIKAEPANTVLREEILLDINSMLVTA